MGRHDPTTPPDPSGGWTYSVKEIGNALIVPHETPERVLPCGVFTGDGAYVPRAATWLRGEAITVAPAKVPEARRRLAGEWLWGGVIYGHFGHFITETTSRLWPVPARRDRLNGVLFVEKYSSLRKGQAGFIPEFFRLLIGDMPVQIVREPTQVENLHVPGQGFGLGEMSRAMRVYRRFIREEFARDIAPDGPERLFISRAQLDLDREGFLGESVFDERMTRAGYEVFRPEEHDLKTQIARYRAARQIVGMDGSAFHLLGLLARPDQNIGVILRRQRGRSRAMGWQLESFSGREPHIIGALKQNRFWVVGKKSALQDFDMERVGRRLKAVGLIGKSVEWGPLTQEEEAMAAQQLAAQKAS